MKNKLIVIEKNNINETSVVSFLVGNSLKDIERAIILETLKRVNGNQSIASEMLQISTRTIRNKLKEYKK